MLNLATLDIDALRESARVLNSLEWELLRAEKASKAASRELDKPMSRKAVREARDTWKAALECERAVRAVYLTIWAENDRP